MGFPEPPANRLSRGRVLLLDHDAERRCYLTHILNFLAYDVLPDAQPSELAAQLAEAGSATLVLLGPALPPGVRDAVLTQFGRISPRPPLLVVDLDAAELKALSARGLDPLGGIGTPTQYDLLVGLLYKAHAFVEAQSPTVAPKRSLDPFPNLSGNSRGIQRVNRMIQQVADSDATVLILGESGTGKEVVARKLHNRSGRCGGPFVPINCGAIPADLLESELFGHEKGAFTGAISARQGRFEMAERGTLLLDEIGDMSTPMQVKILRVLQERTFERVGGNKTLHADVRIIAATHRNLEQAIREGRFREDLYYRINVFPIEMPPLRERSEDLPLLIADLITHMEREKRGSMRLTPAALTALAQYAWPGNVRELANLVERLAILYPFGVVDVADLPEKFHPVGGALEPGPEREQPLANLATTAPGPVGLVQLPEGGFDLKAHLNDLEITLIRQALEETGGVVAHAAERLKMRRTTLVEKLRKYGLQRGPESEN